MLSKTKLNGFVSFAIVITVTTFLFFVSVRIYIDNLFLLAAIALLTASTPVDAFVPCSSISTWTISIFTCHSIFVLEVAYT